MDQIDLEGMPESIQEAARDFGHSLENAQRYVGVAWSAGYRLRNTIEEAHEEGLITDEQKNEAMSYDMDSLIREIAEVSSPTFNQKDVFWYGEEPSSEVVGEVVGAEEDDERPCGRIKEGWQKIMKWGRKK